MGTNLLRLLHVRKNLTRSTYKGRLIYSVQRGLSSTNLPWARLDGVDAKDAAAFYLDREIRVSWLDLQACFQHRSSGRMQ